MTTPNTPPAVPEGVPAKFVKDGNVDVAALAQSYNELSKKLGTATPAPTPETPPTPTPNTPATPPAAPAPEKPVTPPAAEEGFSKYEQEFATNGTLSETSYAELQTKYGFSKQRVDSYIKFQQAEAEAYAKNITDVVGGVDTYKQMAAWAAANFNEGDQKAFDTAIKSGDLNAAKLAVAGLKTKYEAANGRDPNLVSGSVGGGQFQPFRSLDDAVKFRANPKYKTDPDYQREYMQRLSISKL